MRYNSGSSQFLSRKVNLSLIQAVRGMNDILPQDTPHWQYLEQLIRDCLATYSYQEIRLPMVESTTLFCRSIGDVTDIVEKEMYTFLDRNGDSLTLRPEGTAQCVRACLEHGLLHHQTPHLYYMGPMFRHERPQKGRYRQFFQLGVETLGLEGPETDAEHLEMMARLWEALELTPHIHLQLNTLGSLDARQHYKTALVAYFSKHTHQLDEDSTRRLSKNPLRILDSKNPDMADLLAGAPSMADFIDDASQQHFEEVCQLLEAVGIPYQHNPRLVRGLDYYCKTVYEWVTPLLGAQSTVCGGGRYDGLVAELGGKPTPAVGFSVGLERLLLLAKTISPPPTVPAPDVFMILLGTTQAGFILAKQCRDAKLSVQANYGGGSLKNQLKRADGSQARWAFILGDEELTQQCVLIKWLRADKPQEKVAFSNLPAWIKKEYPHV
jgi:histidyl-tRNA synthetase